MSLIYIKKVIYMNKSSINVGHSLSSCSSRFVIYGSPSPKTIPNVLTAKARNLTFSATIVCPPFCIVGEGDVGPVVQ